MKRALFGAALLLVTGGAGGEEQLCRTIGLRDTHGQTIGTATLTQENGLTIRLDLHNLPPGEHGLHFHERSQCRPPDFKSAGAHFNPEHKGHGAHNAAGPHAGDLPNITVGPSGRLTTTVRAERVTLAKGDHSLLANGGTALVIHAGPDDLKTNPAGNSGDRIACGVIRP